MSIGKRIRDISVATLNDRLERAEDPVKLIDQYLFDLNEQIRANERLHQQCIQHAASLRHQYDASEQTAGRREQQALIALKAGEEEVAKLALQEKMQHVEKAAQYGKLYEESRATVIELEQQLQQMRSDYREVYDKRQFYALRMQSLQLQQRMNRTFSNHAASADGSTMFKRLEDRIGDMEAEAQALSDIRRRGQQLLHEVGTNVQTLLESELGKLKQRLNAEHEGGARG